MALSKMITLPAAALTLFVFFSIAKHALAVPTPYDILLASRNTANGPVSEIQCYALPYGAIGIISHLLTYWTIAWMAIGKIPLWPWHPMTNYKLDMALAAVALCTCIPIASITMHRCRLSWHFLLLCIWKLLTSVSLACITLHRGFITRRDGQHHYHATHNHWHHHAFPTSFRSILSMFRSRRGRNDLTPLWWLTLHLAGTFIGMVGLCSLLYTTFRHDRTIQNLTYGFGAAMSIIPILVAIYWYTHDLERLQGHRAILVACWHAFGGAVLAFAAAFGFFSALYSDLVLGAIADNLFGSPSEDFAPLYWTWFFAKRLPLLSL